MNRLILIGNGFDLAHGLKTSYADFIDWYWTKRVRELWNIVSNISDDGLCKLTIKNNTWNVFAFNSLPPNTNDGRRIINHMENHSNEISVKYAPMFQDICDSVEIKKWVDIEDIFYKHLVKANKNSHSSESVNKELETIKSFLIKYLNEIEKKIPKNIIIPDIQEKFSEPIKENDIAIGSTKTFNDWFSFDHKPDKILLLNFNYTSTISKYLSKFTIFETKPTPLNIHGSLNNPQSIIFGYGDELDENYKMLLNKNDNEFLKNIKSFRYFESSNHKNLLSFMESSHFQVYIMGHSCGISDRTLLNKIFEHKNCISIKPFYYKKEDGTDNYLEIAQNISRNLTNTRQNSKKIVDKTLCECLPQKKRI